ncbi:MAG: hypothetical protein AAGA73_02310 [Pseudomonadota bacterium]
MVNRLTPAATLAVLIAQAQALASDYTGRQRAIDAMSPPVVDHERLEAFPTLLFTINLDATSDVGAAAGLVPGGEQLVQASDFLQLYRSRERCAGSYGDVEDAQAAFAGVLKTFRSDLQIGFHKLK